MKNALMRSYLVSIVFDKLVQWWNEFIALSSTHSDDGMDRAEKMLATLKEDFHATWESKSRECGHISLDAYKDKFGVSDEDIRSYCDTLTPLTPIFPVCPRCGSEWYDKGPNKVKPINNGHIIDWVDSFETFCVSEDHDTLWYCQNKDGGYSLTMEADNLNGCDYEVRWNCGCMVQQCYRKNVIYKRPVHDYENLELVGFYTNEQMPYNISREDLIILIEDSK